MTEPTSSVDLSSDLATLLAANGVPPTVDGVLAEFERREVWFDLNHAAWPRPESERWWVNMWWGQGKQYRVPGPSALVALAEAFAAIVGENQP